jgi:hypothetical protein
MSIKIGWAQTVEDILPVVEIAIEQPIRPPPEAASLTHSGDADLLGSSLRDDGGFVVRGGTRARWASA